MDTILFLTQVLPYPLDAGPKVRAYYVLRYLAQHHDVTLLSFVRPTDTSAAIDHLRTYCHALHVVPMRRSKRMDAWFLAKSLLVQRPFIIERDASRAMDGLLAEVASQAGPFDAVHADQLWMAPYALRARAHASASGSLPHVVLDQHNAVYMILRRLAAAERNPVKRMLLGQEADKLAMFEVATCAAFDRVTWVTQEDHDAVQAVTAAPVRNDGVLPICGSPEDTSPMVRRPDARRVTFLGGLHYPPNAQGVLWFAEHVFPRVLASQSDAILTIIGKHPPDALRSFGIPARNLEITGYVDDPQPYLAETAAFVVPLLAGGGMRVKIMDGWSWRLPIVSTRIGAEGIECVDGANILLADTPVDFSAAVIALLADPAQNGKIAEGGRQWVVERYNWRTVYRQWDRIYGDAGRQAGPGMRP